MKESWAAFEKRITREQLSLLKTVNYQESLGFSCVIAVRSGGMITILSAVVSVLSFRFRSRASLELELVALRHQLIVLRRQRPRRLRLHSVDRLLWVCLYRVGRGSLAPWYSSNRRQRSNGIAKAFGSTGGGD